MSTRDVIAFSAIPLVLLASAWLIDCYSFWSRLANVTLPWLCSAVALAMLILGATCAVMQCRPAEIRRGVAILVVAGTLVIFEAGMLVDAYSYSHVDTGSDWASRLPDDWLSSVGESIGFAVILGGVFALPRRRAPDPASTP